MVLVLLIARIQSILNIPREAVGHEDTQVPDCSSITDARNNESLYLLVRELDGNLDLKMKMPDDQARQVRETSHCFSSVLNFSSFFFALEVLFRISTISDI